MNAAEENRIIEALQQWVLELARAYELAERAYGEARVAKDAHAADENKVEHRRRAHNLEIRRAGSEFAYARWSTGREALDVVSVAVERARIAKEQP